jgi:hypothetical protein
LFRKTKIRSFICALLALLLVAIQQVGFAHALTHLVGQTSRSDTPHPAQKVCIECIAFAQIGTGLTTHPPQLPLVAAAIPVAAAPAGNHIPAFVPHFHSRAPPSRI